MTQKHVKLIKVSAEGLVCTQVILGFVQQEECQANGKGDKRWGFSRSLFSRRHLAGRSTSHWYAANACDLHPGRGTALEQLSEHGCIRRHQVSII